MVVQLDYDKEEEQCYTIYGTMLAETEVQRTIQRAELQSFTRLDHQPFPQTTWASLMACGEVKRVAVGVNTEMRTCVFLISELLEECAETAWDLDVKRVNAHRIKKRRP